MADPRPIILRIDAAAICDDCATIPAAAALLELRPGAERRLRLIAAGPAAEIGRHPASAGATAIDRRRCILVPGLVNAHTHLDLTHIGPRPHDPGAGFIHWVEQIRRQRLTDDAAIEASVRRGVELCLAGGTVAVGDIAGAPAGRPSLAPLRALRARGLIGVSSLEFFGIGLGEAGAAARVEAALDAAGAPVADGVALGLQPHASNTIGINLYRWSAGLAARRGLPICTHLAETPEEREFVARASGPQRAFLEQLGLWDDGLLQDVGRGQTPVGRLAGVIGAGLRTLVHVNDASDEDIDALAAAGATVVYCPRSSTYFGAEAAFGPHRYRDMAAAGVSIALGTDSLVNLPPEAQVEGVSVWDEMRLLHERDGAAPAALLQMATTGGARALGLDPGRFRFEPGAEPAGIVAVEVPASGGGPEDAAGEQFGRKGGFLGASLAGSGRPELLLDGKISGLAEISALRGLPRPSGDP